MIPKGGGGNCEMANRDGSGNGKWKISSHDRKHWHWDICGAGRSFFPLLWKLYLSLTFVSLLAGLCHCTVLCLFHLIYRGRPSSPQTVTPHLIYALLG